MLRFAQHDKSENYKFSRTGEIRLGKFSVVFSSGFVIGLRGVDFIAEVAEVVGFVIAGYLGGPFFAFFVPVDAFVF